MSELIVTKVGEVAIVNFVGTEILDMAQSKAIGIKLCATVEQPDVSCLVIDFGRVKLITSSMIGELIQVRKKSAERQVILKLCSLSSELIKLLKLLKLDKSFEIYASRELAVKALQANKK